MLLQQSPEFSDWSLDESFTFLNRSLNHLLNHLQFSQGAKVLKFSDWSLDEPFQILNRCLNHLLNHLQCCCNGSSLSRSVTFHRIDGPGWPGANWVGRASYSCSMCQVLPYFQFLFSPQKIAFRFLKIKFLVGERRVAFLQRPASC